MKIPDNGETIRFRRADEQEWRQGEFDAENGLFIEIFSPEVATHNVEDIAEWLPLEQLPGE